MSDKVWCRLSKAVRLLSICWVITCATTATAAIDGTDANAIDGTDALAIDGTDALAIDGTDLLAIDGTDAQAIDGTDAQAIDGTDIYAIDGTDAQAIDGTDIYAIDGTDAQAIDGTDIYAIDGTDAQAIDGTDLLVLGQVEFVADNFFSVLGQSVFSADSRFVRPGATVAVYGTIDESTGGIVNARVRTASSDLSFLRGIVDEVDRSIGRAVVSGVTVDYTALLSNGQAPDVGDVMAITGRSYSQLGLLVAQP
ncbi:MAG TPA: hypothetical protein VFG91_06085 [Woeseiaceae bacterium]|nr:hypothetical protein [Woeseiaceae bacterium]